ncbi:hypothetical protein MKX01_029562, partial [Papaver californicum]
MTSIASSTSTWDQVHRPAFKIYTDFRNKSEDDDLGDGNIYPNQTLHARGINDEPAPPYIVLVQGPPNLNKVLADQISIAYFIGEHFRVYIRSPITVIA